MLGFDTIGNATVVAYDGTPIIATDPWLGEPAYFGSWGLPFEIPEEQKTAILNAEFIWLSHGHPDHLNPEALEKLQGRKILLPHHVGDRIRDDLTAAGFDVTVLVDSQWTQLSDRIRVFCISDYFQDAVLLIDVGGTLIVNLNDATDRGWGRRVKRIIRGADRSFMLKLFGYGDVDMMNFIDDDGNRIVPQSVRKRPIGEQIGFFAKLYGVTDIIPFSCFHRYQRSDSIWTNEHTTPLEVFYDGFDLPGVQLHPAFIRFDVETGAVSTLNPAPSDEKLFAPEEFGDDWNEPFRDDDREKASTYFKRIEALGNDIDFVRLVVGGDELMIDLPGGSSGPSSGRGVTFEAPRNSLMTAIGYEIFDDLLIGNFMKTRLHGDWESVSLHPHFTPFVAKYADNGRARSKAELDAYFAEYRKRAPMAYLAHVLERESERRVRKFIRVDSPAFRLAKKTYLFLKRA
jgi:hypothetical protein